MEETFDGCRNLAQDQQRQCQPAQVTGIVLHICSALLLLLSVLQLPAQSYCFLLHKMSIAALWWHIRCQGNCIEAHREQEVEVHAVQLCVQLGVILHQRETLCINVNHIVYQCEPTCVIVCHTTWQHCMLLCSALHCVLLICIFMCTL